MVDGGGGGGWFLRPSSRRGHRLVKTNAPVFHSSRRPFFGDNNNTSFAYTVIYGTASFLKEPFSDSFPPDPHHLGHLRRYRGGQTRAFRSYASVGGSKKRPETRRTWRKRSAAQSPTTSLDRKTFRSVFRIIVGLEWKGPTSHYCQKPLFNR